MPDEMIWPLRGVSKDPNNLLTLGSDGQVMADKATTDASYVLKAGDTMMGQLLLERDGTRGAANVALRCYSDAANAVVSFTKTRGTKAEQAPLLAGDFVGRLVFNTITATGATVASNISCISRSGSTATGCATEFTFVNTDEAGAMGESLRLTSSGIYAQKPVQGTLFVRNGLAGIAQEVQVIDATANSANQAWGIRSSVDVATKNAACFVASHTGKGTDFSACYVADATMPAGATNYAFVNNSLAQSYLRGNVGINWQSPTHNLEVGGTTMLRGTCEITGNITSAGTDHSFANGSIPSPAVIGNTPRTIAATGSAGSAGQMVWDDNFLYLRTTAGWKKVALTAI